LALNQILELESKYQKMNLENSTRSQYAVKEAGFAKRSSKSTQAFSLLIYGRRKGRMRQHLAASSWQLAKPQEPRAKDRTVIDETEQI
jgi:hypothetical protein